MRWFKIELDPILAGVSSRNECREYIRSILDGLTFSNYIGDIDFENFDIVLFNTIYTHVHSFVHMLNREVSIIFPEEVIIVPLHHHAECNMKTDMTHSLILYIANIIYRSLMKCMMQKHMYVIYDADVYCCEELVNKYGAEVVDAVTNNELNFNMPVFNMDHRVMLQQYQIHDDNRVRYYDSYFEINEFPDQYNISSYFGRIIEYYDTNDVYKPQRLMLDAREKAITDREIAFDNDCEAYEIEATKWKARMESKILAVEERAESEAKWCKLQIAIMEREIMKCNDINFYEHK